ncbi:MAG: DUF502 domain-containing protein [Burkholderiales bacterium]|nr:DUF502 domain-containing protein [Burkholderiales bacterium]
MQKTGEKTTPHFGRYTVIGVLTLAPLWVTWIVFDFILGLLARVGSPWVAVLARLARPYWEGLADALLHPSFRYFVAIVITLVLFYAVGWIASRVAGRRLIALFERLVGRIPLADAVYGATKRLIAVMRERPAGLQRVVLINFPSPQMKTVGFVTRTLADQTTGRMLAAVYVPTSPNPTSGYIEIVPVEDVTQTDWTVEEAMRFIMTGGTNAPAEVRFTAAPGEAGLRSAEGQAR